MNYPLRDLKTREPGDFSIALLDAWATVADVLTFYQERIANEGYLRTATERRSVLELARLVGYALRPGVASSAFLAYTIDEDRSQTLPKGMKTVIPVGSKAQSVPGPGELPQTFETSDEIEARTEWNNLQVRMTQPQTKESIRESEDLAPQASRVFLKGIATNLKQNDPLLIDFATGNPELFRIIEVTPDAAADRTLVRLQEWVPRGVISPLGAVVRDVVERHIKAAEALTPPVRNMAKTSITRLKQLPAEIAHLTDLEKREFIKAQVVEKFAATLAAAQPVAQKKKFADWLNGVVKDLTQVIEAASASGVSAAAAAPDSAQSVITSSELIEPLLKPSSRPPPNTLRLGREVQSTFTRKGDAQLQLLNTFQPSLKETLTTALANAEVTQRSGIKVYALRVKAGLFGNNALGFPIYTKEGEGTIKITGYSTVDLNGAWHGLIEGLNPLRTLALDVQYDQIKPTSWVVIEFLAETVDAMAKVVERKLSFHRVNRVGTAAMSVSSISSRITQLEVEPPWMSELTPAQRRNQFAGTEALRGTTVFAQSEELPLAEEPIPDDVCHGKDTPIELDGIYSGMESGRWLIVSGERTDIKNTAGVIVPGVKGSELVMLASVTQEVQQIVAGDKSIDLAGDKRHSFIRLANEDLAYCYKRDTVKIYGNVVKATHGETRREVLGGGDASKALQQFTLRQPPLTHVAAPAAKGAKSTLRVRVNEVEWHETDTLAGLTPNDRKFVTQTDDDGKTQVVFGNGREGARPPTGAENIVADYRNGIGKPGNVKAEQISLLMSRPLGVRDVINPLPATGGANRESRDQARQNAPLAVLALDRLVSVQDYADFARTFAGIGKASATRLSDGRLQRVHVTIAGADDIPIATSSDLYRNLVQALHDLGEPHLPIEVDVRELKLLVLSARVQVLPDFAWEFVEPKIRAALLDAFGFERRDLGQDVTASEVISAIQHVRGVAYVDLDKFDGLSEEDVLKAFAEGTALANNIHLVDRVVAELARPPAATSDDRTIQPAQLILLSPAVPDTLILQEITS